MTPKVEDDYTKGPLIGMRHVQTFLLFLFFMIYFHTRSSVNLAVVAIMHGDTANPDYPQYDWTEKHRSYILSSFHWGFLPMILPGNFIVRRFGVKRSCLFVTISWTLLNAITPFCLSWGSWQAYCGIRVLIGMGSAICSTSTYVHMSNWFPAMERSRLGVIAFTGIDYGIVLSSSFNGVLARSSFGWPTIFYASSIMSFLYSLLWIFLGADNAPSSRFISKAELLYIETSLQHSTGHYDKTIPIPWRAISSSVPIWALFAASAAYAWCASTIEMQLPAFLHGVIEMNIEKNGFTAGVPYIVMSFLSCIYMTIAEILMKHKIISLPVIRKSFNTMAFWGSAIVLPIISFMHNDQAGFVFALIMVRIVFNSGLALGTPLNPIDLSPNHAGTLNCISTAIGSVCSMLEAIVVGFIVYDTSDRAQWRIVFFATSAVYFFGNLIFIIWGSTDVQPWNAADFSKTKDIDCESKVEQDHTPQVMNDQEV